MRIIFAKSNDNHRWYKLPGEAEPGNPETWNHLRRKTGLTAGSQLLYPSPSSPFSIIIRTTRKQEQEAVVAGIQQTNFDDIQRGRSWQPFSECKNAKCIM